MIPPIAQGSTGLIRLSVDTRSQPPAATAGCDEAVGRRSGPVSEFFLRGGNAIAQAKRALRNRGRLIFDIASIENFGILAIRWGPSLGLPSAVGEVPFGRSFDPQPKAQADGRPTAVRRSRLGLRLRVQRLCVIADSPIAAEAPAPFGRRRDRLPSLNLGPLPLVFAGPLCL